MIVRNVGCTACVEAGRVVLSLCLMMFWFRILHIFSVHKELGPKLVMIGRMVRGSASASSKWLGSNEV